MAVPNAHWGQKRWKARLTRFHISVQNSRKGERHVKSDLQLVTFDNKCVQDSPSDYDRKWPSWQHYSFGQRDAPNGDIPNDSCRKVRLF